MKNLLPCLILCSFLLLSSQDSMAQTNGFAARYLFVDYQTPFDQSPAEFTEDFTNGMEISYVRSLNRYLNLAIPLKVARARLPIPPNSYTNKHGIVSLDALLHLKAFDVDKILSPYFLGGVGYVEGWSSSDGNFQFPVGAGFNLRLAPNTFFSAQAEYRFSADENRNNIQYGIGGYLNFGEIPPPPPPPPVEPPAPTDRDDDGVIDDEDECPDTPGLAAFSGCPDTDNDGIADANDECPDVAGVLQFNGCPDTDGDGTQDKMDECPNEPGPASNKGCPLSDRDGDGVVDDDDDCPDAPGTVANKGCPDSDGDGVVDKDDKCPDTPGLVRLNGCPEIEKEDREVLDFAMKNLQFETGRATLKAASLEILNQVVDIMNKYPDYSLSIAGHTDSVGSKSTNQVLSEKRAKSAYDYIISKGISPTRMSYAGYGESQPIADNMTKEGRALNRRTEFNIYLK